MKICDLEDNLTIKSKEETVTYMMELSLLRRTLTCDGICKSPMKLEKSLRYTDGVSWRCYTKGCDGYQKRTSVRKFSFFDGFCIEMSLVLKVLLRWVGGQQRSSIINTLNLTEPTLRKVFTKLIVLMNIDNKKQPKLGGPGYVVQIDETMLNYKVKSHRGRSAYNKSDALCIVEVKDNMVKKVWAQVIENKKIETIIPIILEKVVPGSTIYTDEHKSYSVLGKLGFLHGHVCHKYNFVDKDTMVNTQGVESFNNVIKIEIKKRKGVKTYQRGDLLVEIIWKWNNKYELLGKLIELIKV